MKQITKEELKTIVKSIELETNEAVLEDILKLWNQLGARLDQLNEFDLTNVKPLSHLYETPVVDFLREDIVDQDLVKISKQDLLNNAAEHDEDYIITNKVVK
ncbi:Asp-tRNA(Asn)/Glu-tRNA(Gln) amidotransferase subunit GatC [Mycoplasmopsis felifaucium]|uniref:Asp-tRNA(Asn)/Glu-tRNA(Gln) amidotransferase subunit GatC n=1 Tax=Mycoplasmopsis felifaucium TaxID=35768 RepID=A0ABZ2RWN6_9BACT